MSWDCAEKSDQMNLITETGCNLMTVDWARS
jgi:hypothetical protein